MDSLGTPILITGASGFVGSNLLRTLASLVPPKRIHVVLRKNSDTWRITDLVRKTSVHEVDLRSYSSTERIIGNIRPKTVFHLATHGAYPSQQYDEQEILETNVLSTFNLIRSSLRTGFDAFVNTGSSSEYGSKSKPMREDDVLEPNTAYGASKAWATLYGAYAAAAHRAPLITIRPFSVYGYFEPIGRLVPNVILSLMKGVRPRLSSPRVARDFIFIEDLIEAYLRAAAHPQTRRAIFNVGSGRETTLKEIFEVTRDVLGVDLDPIWDKHAGRSFDTAHWVADVTRAKKELKWRPRTSLREGLRKSIAWFEKHSHLYGR